MSRIAKAAGIALGTGAMVLGGAGLAAADATAEGAALHSPGVLSGNLIQIPIHVPINVCGNTINVGGALNPAFGNVCINDGGHKDKDDDKKSGDKNSNDGYGS
jgi:hypothetical protein